MVGEGVRFLIFEDTHCWTLAISKSGVRICGTLRYFLHSLQESVAIHITLRMDDVCDITTHLFRA